MTKSASARGAFKVGGETHPAEGDVHIPLARSPLSDVSGHASLELSLRLLQHLFGVSCTVTS
jgi:hypothetical protein